MSSSIKTDAWFPNLMERATHSAILERKKKQKQKGKHVFRQAFSKSVLTQGSVRFVGGYGQWSPA